MDFLNKAYVQIQELFRSMTVGARIVSGLLLIVVVVSIAYLFNHEASGPDEFLMNGEGFPVAQLPAMEAAFNKAGLSAYRVDGNRIRVPRSQQSAYMGALADANALPKNFGDHIMHAADSASPFTSMSSQKQMMKVALEQELAQVISSMRGIEAASVLYDSETDTGLNQRQVVTATVSVQPTGNDSLDEDRVQTIRQVVAGAISGLSPKNVVVADLKTGTSFTSSSDGPGVGSDDPYSVTKRNYERDWENKIRGALSAIPGVNVKVNVELNPELQSDSTDVKVDTKAVPIDVSDVTKSVNTQGASSGGGRPGLPTQGGVNAPGAVSNASSGGSKSDVEDTTHHEKNLVSSTNTIVKRAPLTPRRVTVTVGVLSDYYEKIWAEQHPATAGAEPKKPDANALATMEDDLKKKIQSFVSQLIPLPPQGDGAPKEVTPLVTVMTFQHIASAPIVPPTIAEKTLSWMNQYWSTLGTIGLGLVSLVVLRSMVRAVPATESPRPTPAVASSASFGQAAESSESAAAEVQEAAAKLKRRVKSGPSMRDELVEIVREDPDAAANILRSWIGSAT